MKNSILFSIFFCLGIQFAFAQYPIPSYNAPIDSLATFTERSNTSKLAGKINNTDIRRVMNIEYYKNLPDSGSITIYVYSLDHQTTLGPFYLLPDGLLAVEIDEREWGIIVFTLHEVRLDVWIE